MRVGRGVAAGSGRHPFPRYPARYLVLLRANPWMVENGMVGVEDSSSTSLFVLPFRHLLFCYSFLSHLVSFLHLCLPLRPRTRRRSRQRRHGHNHHARLQTFSSFRRFHCIRANPPFVAILDRLYYRIACALVSCVPRGCKQVSPPSPVKSRNAMTLDLRF